MVTALPLSCPLNPLALLFAFTMASSFGLAVFEFVYVSTWFHSALSYPPLKILVPLFVPYPFGSVALLRRPTWHSPFPLDSTC